MNIQIISLGNGTTAHIFNRVLISIPVLSNKLSDLETMSNGENRFYRWKNVMRPDEDQTLRGKT